MKKVLLLGSNGQLGSDIIKVFAEKGQFDVQALLRKDLDVEDTNSIANTLERFGEFEILINCTSYHKTDECEDFPQRAFLVNAASVAEIAKYCNQKNRTVVHISTDYVFDGNSVVPYTEEDMVRPLNVYGVSKVAGEQLIQAYHDRFFILRVSSLFGAAGASGKGGNFVETMLKLAKEEKPLRVVDDQIMSPTSTLEIARAIHALLLQEPKYGIYHCSGEGECSWHGFASEIFRQAGLMADLSSVSSEEFVTKAKRPRYSVLSNEKLSRYYRMPAWQDSLSEYLRLKHWG